MSDDLFPHGFDKVYFSGQSWADRVATWVAEHDDQPFSAGNAGVIRSVLEDADTGVRAVVNITAFALLRVLEEGAYRNLYDRPVIGGERRGPSPTRVYVDSKLGLNDGCFFAAVALGGTGVRYYGEYCMVLKKTAVPPNTRLFDRDSYDILIEPLAALSLSQQQIDALRGVWDTDVIDMALLRTLPVVGSDIRLVTSGTVSDAVLRDQEFIEVHITRRFGPNDVEEVRESPDEVAIEMSLLERERLGMSLTAVDQEWVRRRAEVAQRLNGSGLRRRVVTLHGKGYQWK